jgi:hypothetical protein
MTDKKIEKLAAKDAESWLAAEMAYGEGAGTRRKLVSADIEGKQWSMPGYFEAFQAAYEQLDKTKFAKEAIKERKHLDRVGYASKNFRALKAGKIQNLSTGVYVIVGGAYLAHVTGYDKKIEAEAKRLIKKAKDEIEVRKARRKLADS